MSFRQLVFVGLICSLGSQTAGASDINLGQGIYRQHCLMCHGNDGRGDMAGAPDFKRGQGLMQTDQALAVRIHNGKNACPAYRGILDEQEILDVIAYIRTLF